MALETEAAFDRAEKQFKPMPRKELEAIRPPMPGDDVGYVYGEGRYAAGYEPEGLRPND